MEKTFSKEHTNIAKGIAVIMLLIHHLFYSTDYAYTELQIFGINFWNTLAFFCKTTVAIFVILSGFGLYKSFSKHENLTEFYKKHFAKIYLNYWYIWLLFVPAGLFIYGRTFQTIYGDHTILKLAGNLLGVQNYFGYWGYNPTWWFISLILALYLIFPLLYFLSKRKYILEILFFASFSLYAVKCNLNYILCYLPSFIGGILIAKYSLFEKTYTVLTKNKLNVYAAIALFFALLAGRITTVGWISGGGGGRLYIRL